jgi:hypothetical protein
VIDQRRLLKPRDYRLNAAPAWAYGSLASRQATSFYVLHAPSSAQLHWANGESDRAPAMVC